MTTDRPHTHTGGRWDRPQPWPHLEGRYLLFFPLLFFFLSPPFSLFNVHSFTLSYFIYLNNGENMQITHLLVHFFPSPKAHNVHSQAKARTGNSIRVSHRNAGSPSPLAIMCCLSGALAKSWLYSRGGGRVRAQTC